LSGDFLTVYNCYDVFIGDNFMGLVVFFTSPKIVWLKNNPAEMDKAKRGMLM